MKILVINAGSSSLKYQLVDMDGEKVLAQGLCERIGIDGHLKHKPSVSGKQNFDADVSLPSHSEAIEAVIEKLTSKDYGVLNSMSLATICAPAYCWLPPLVMAALLAKMAVGI